MDNGKNVAELLSLCGVWKTYHFESPMLHLNTNHNRMVGVFLVFIEPFAYLVGTTPATTERLSVQYYLKSGEFLLQYKKFESEEKDMVHIIDLTVNNIPHDMFLKFNHRQMITKKWVRKNNEWKLDNAFCG